MPETKPTRFQYNASFLRALDRLNPGQREAVEHIEGPVLVIAGPGTGKTHILTARIGRILMETDTQPHNILCLTFTDAGVRAMRERLLEFIGPEAHRVHIYTFHSFCNRIIQENLELFGRHDLEPLSPLERIEIIRHLIDRLDIDHPLKRNRNDVYFYEEYLYDLFRRIKKEDWSVEFMDRRIREYLGDLAGRPEFVYQRRSGSFEKGDPKEAKIADERRRMERLRAAAGLYPQYQEAMRRARRYDYDDMILWVLRAFEENEALLRTYQEQYLYFLVDEYQDTNGAQNEVLRKLIDFWKNPNVFIVGDDDQSIYEFQGARLKNLTDFYQEFRQDLKLVLLRHNYRSSQSILDTSGALIRYNERRVVRQLRELGIEKKLEARHETYGALPGRPRLLVYPNRMQEETDIVGRIARLREQGFPLEEVAVIYARHKQAHNLIRLLEKKGIPYNTKRKVNILTLPLIENLRTLLDYLDLESRRPFSGEHLLFPMLHFRFLDITPLDVARLGARLAGEESRRWREALQDEALLREAGVAGAEAIRRFSRLLEELLHELHQLPLPALLERLLNRTGLLRYVLDQPDRDWLLAVVKTFFDFVGEESARRPRLTLRQLMELLRRLEANRLPLSIQKEVHAEGGVNLVTAHSAKGLEFRCVFVLDCVQDYWEPRGRRSSYRFALPDTLTFSGEEDALEARRRLFYVAMTRAKESLCFSRSRRDQAGKELRRTVFLDEIVREMELEEVPVEVPEADLFEAQVLSLQENAAPRLAETDAALIDHLLTGFALSITSLNSYLKCPLGFFYEHVLRVPVQESEAAAYGTAMHNALQRLFERRQRAKNRKYPPKEELLRLFAYEMKRRRGQFGPAEYQRRLEMGRRHLDAYDDLRRPGWPDNVRVEYHIRQAEVEGVPVIGTIDRLEWADAQSARIVDYKTGQSTPDKVQAPTTANPHGGPYWRQLAFYKLLYENSGNPNRLVTGGAISYLDPDPDGNFVEASVTFHPEEVAAVRRLIRQTYDKIMRHEFRDGCGDPACPWCQFVLRQASFDSFADAELESLDD